MGLSRQSGFCGTSRQKVVARVKILAVIISFISMVTPLRNLLMPSFFWHDSWYDLHTLKLLRIHIFDLFYYIDRSPYQGSCKDVRHQLEPLKKIKLEELSAYSLEDWYSNLEKVMSRFSSQELWKLDHFKPSLTVDEQREMLYSTLVLAQALDIFNVTYFVAEGSLIGAYRHHGLIPWDDDVDFLIKGSQWQRAREVLSCIPDFSLSMGRDFMWKFMWNRSKFWRYESFIRFPYVDVFPYNEDADHLWPLTIWMKRDLIWRTAESYPSRRLPFEGYSVAVPQNPSEILKPHYGPDADQVCASRIFNRRERESFPEAERVQIPCSYLYEIYPFVFQNINPEDGSSVQVRKIGNKILSTYKA